jgi:hypothetical protein
VEKKIASLLPLFFLLFFFFFFFFFFFLLLLLAPLARFHSDADLPSHAILDHVLGICHHANHTSRVQLHLQVPFRYVYPWRMNDRCTAGLK